jgi:hypothetical protein
MSLYYHGTIEELVKLLRKHGLVGSWEIEPYGVYMFREDDGAHMHWSSTSGKAWFTADSLLQYRLRRKIVAIFKFDMEQRKRA